jgi:RHS repeat-associated protein
MDADGRQTFSQTDLLGRTVATGTYNPAASTYNYTATTYNALGLAVQVRTYHGAAQDYTSSTYYNSVGLPVMSVDPNGRTSYIAYDGDLRVSTTTDVMGHVAVYSYAAGSGQPGYKLPVVSSIGLKASAGGSVCGTCTESFTYDWTLNTLTDTNSTAVITHVYDSLRRMTSEGWNVGGSAALMWTNYTYDVSSRVTGITYASAHPSPAKNQGTAGYVYDTLGRVSQVKFNGTLYATTTYDPYGRLTRVGYYQAGTDTGEYQNYSYDVANRITATGVLGGVNAMQLVYHYDPASLITSVTDGMVYSGGAFSYKTDTYAYDANGRLVYANGPFSNQALSGSPSDNQMAILSYTYDAYGFISTKKDSDISATPVTYNLDSTHYEAVASSTGGVSETFTHSDAGSMLSRSGWYYTFDYGQQLVGACKVSGCGSGYKYAYAYDGEGRKVKEVDTMASTYTLYFAYLGSNLAYQYNATSHTGSVYVYLGGALLFRKDSSQTAHFYASDLSDNVRVVLSYSGGVTVEGQFRYKPFGEQAKPLVNPAPLNPSHRFSDLPTTSTTGLTTMGARHYAPDLGRFLSRDPIGFHDHAYAADNPISLRDPSGLDPISDLLNPWGKALSDLWNGFVNAVGGSLNTLYNNLMNDPTAPFGNLLPVAPNGRGVAQDPFNNFRTQWRSLDPGTRNTIIVVGAVAVTSIVTFGLADAVDWAAVLAAASDWVGGGLAALSTALGLAESDDAAAALAPELDTTPALSQVGPEVDVAQRAVDLWWAGLRSGLDKFEFGEFGTDLDVWGFQEEFDSFMQSMEMTGLQGTEAAELAELATAQRIAAETLIERFIEGVGIEEAMRHWYESWQNPGGLPVRIGPMGVASYGIPG